MKPVSHSSNTRILAAPAGWDQSGLPVEPLGITDTEIEGVPCVMSFWQLEPEDLACIRAGGLVGLSIVGRTMPPAAVVTVLPPGEAPLEHPDKSPTEGMNLGQRIAHVGGRENAQGYIEFGSVMAVQALMWHVLRDDLQRATRWTPEPTEATKQRIIAEFLESTGHYVTNDASREAAFKDAVEAALRDTSPRAAQVPAPLNDVLRDLQERLDATDRWLGASNGSDVLMPTDIDRTLLRKAEAEIRRLRGVE